MSDHTKEAEDRVLKRLGDAFSARATKWGFTKQYDAETRRMMKKEQNEREAGFELVNEAWMNAIQ